MHVIYPDSIIGLLETLAPPHPTPHPPPETEWQSDTCGNITFPQLHWRAVKNFSWCTTWASLYRSSVLPEYWNTWAYCGYCCFECNTVSSILMIYLSVPSFANHAKWCSSTPSRPLIMDVNFKPVALLYLMVNYSMWTYRIKMLQIPFKYIHYQID